jgi:hypothetical protein
MFKEGQAFNKKDNATAFLSSQVKSLITNNAFCIVQRATAQSKTGFFRDYGVAEAPPGFKAGWSDTLACALRSQSTRSVPVAFAQKEQNQKLCSSCWKMRNLPTSMARSASE